MALAKYKLNDVVFIRATAKAAVVTFVGPNYYDVRTYDGKECTCTEAALGRT